MAIRFHYLRSEHWTSTTTRLSEMKAKVSPLTVFSAVHDHWKSDKHRNASDSTAQRSPNVSLSLAVTSSTPSQDAPQKGKFFCRKTAAKVWSGVKIAVTGLTPDEPNLTSANPSPISDASSITPTTTTAVSSAETAPNLTKVGPENSSKVTLLHGIKCSAQDVKKQERHSETPIETTENTTKVNSTEVPPTALKFEPRNASNDALQRETDCSVQCNEDEEQRIVEELTLVLDVLSPGTDCSPNHLEDRKQCNDTHTREAALATKVNLASDHSTGVKPFETNCLAEDIKKEEEDSEQPTNAADLEVILVSQLSTLSALSTSNLSITAASSGNNAVINAPTNVLVGSTGRTTNVPALKDVALRAIARDYELMKIRLAKARNVIELFAKYLPADPSVSTLSISEDGRFSFYSSRAGSSEHSTAPSSTAASKSSHSKKESNSYLNNFLELTPPINIIKPISTVPVGFQPKSAKSATKTSPVASVEQVESFGHEPQVINSDAGVHESEPAENAHEVDIADGLEFELDNVFGPGIEEVFATEDAISLAGSDSPSSCIQLEHSNFRTMDVEAATYRSVELVEPVITAGFGSISSIASDAMQSTIEAEGAEKEDHIIAPEYNEPAPAGYIIPAEEFHLKFPDHDIKPAEGAIVQTESLQRYISVPNQPKVHGIGKCDVACPDRCYPARRAHFLYGYSTLLIDLDGPAAVGIVPTTNQLIFRAQKIRNTHMFPSLEALIPFEDQLKLKRPMTPSEILANYAKGCIFAIDLSNYFHKPVTVYATVPIVAGQIFNASDKPEYGVRLNNIVNLPSELLLDRERRQCPIALFEDEVPFLSIVKQLDAPGGQEIKGRLFELGPLEDPNHFYAELHGDADKPEAPRYQDRGGIIRQIARATYEPWAHEVHPLVKDWKAALEETRKQATDQMRGSCDIIVSYVRIAGKCQNRQLRASLYGEPHINVGRCIRHLLPPCPLGGMCHKLLGAFWCDYCKDCPHCEVFYDEGRCTCKIQKVKEPNKCLYCVMKAAHRTKVPKIIKWVDATEVAARFDGLWCGYEHHPEEHEKFGREFPFEYVYYPEDDDDEPVCNYAVDAFHR